MKKYFLILFGLIFFSLSTSHTFAAACGSCNAPNYSKAGCLQNARSKNDRAACNNVGGVGGSAPSSNQCNSQCYTPYGVPYCANGGAFRATLDGELVLYGANGQSYSLYVNGAYRKGGAINSGSPTGVNVKSTDWVSISIPGALGWRVIGSPYAIPSAYTFIIGQYISDSCSGGYDSWDFNDWTLAVAIKANSLACGVSGCNSVACAPGNSCISNVCQANCSAGTTRVGYCSCLPPVTCGVSGCNTVGCTSGNSCNANICQANCPAGYFRSGNCACIAECQIPDITLSSTPDSKFTRFMLGINTNITLSRTGGIALPNYVMVSNTQIDSNNTSINAFNCNWTTLSGTAQKTSVNCTIDRKPAYPNTTVNWIHSWCNTDNGSCTNRKVCSTTALPINIDPYGAYLQTNLGNTHIKGTLTMPRFPTSTTSKLSTYNYSTGTNILSNTWLSSKSYLLLNYNDANNFYNSSGLSNIYEYLQSRLSIAAKTTTTGPNPTLSDSTYNSIVGTNDAVFVTGNLTISSTSCKSKTAFFVSGNLNINSDFNTTGNNSCLFIVKGATIVSPSVSTITAFIITNSYNTQLFASAPFPTQTQLKLTGGLIIQTGNSFNRNINYNVTEASALSVTARTTPSELYIYEGARYIKLLGALFYDSTNYSIKEIQYSGKSSD
jgi:hypothetical protein